MQNIFKCLSFGFLFIYRKTNLCFLRIHLFVIFPLFVFMITISTATN